MKLDRVQIQNFRSIKELTIRFRQSCQILVGINESGKTNILRALQLIRAGSKSVDADIRIPLKDEPIDAASEVIFIFTLDRKDIELIKTNVLNKLLVKDVNTAILEFNGKNYSVAQHASSHKEALRWEDIKEHQKHDASWSKSSDREVLEGWVKLTFPPNFAIPNVKSHDDSPRPANSFSFVYLPDYPELASLPKTVPSAAEIDRLFTSAAGALVAEQSPDCIIWRYDDKYLLPPRIQTNTFLENPSSCLPLEQMFALANIQDIKGAFQTANKRGPAAIRNLLDRVADSTTKHINGIWKECKGLQIKLEPNADHIEASILESDNRFDFSSRSDGFKRFISFLLIISARARNGELTNSLLLIDEPEIGLHPSGVKYLRDELLKISEKNKVIISTHSIFMIDRNNIGRHLRVLKKNEITKVLPIDESNFMDEEVVYNAMGYTIFDALQEKNLVFEGWTDKNLFKVAIQKKELKKGLEKIGLCHLQGVKDAARVCPILDLANRNYIVISDNDQTAKDAQAKFSGNGAWLTYRDLLGRDGFVTVEDFIKDEAFKPVIREIKARHESLKEINLSRENGGKIKCIRDWLKSGGLEGESLRIALEEIKQKTMA